MKYKYITKAETSLADADFIFSQGFKTLVLNLQSCRPFFGNPCLSLNNFSEITYLPGEYKSASVGLSDVIKWYQNVTNDVLQDLYRIYFPDFALFEYSIDKFLK